jgi:hypothetical protein
MIKIKIITLLIFATVFSGCSKKEKFMNQGVIAAWSEGACQTCGGFYVNLSNDTTITPHTYYIINTYPQSLNATIQNLMTTAFNTRKEVYISLDWYAADSVAGQPSMYITNIKGR